MNKSIFNKLETLNKTLKITNLLVTMKELRPKIELNIKNISSNKQNSWLKWNRDTIISGSFND